MPRRNERELTNQHCVDGHVAKELGRDRRVVELCETICARTSVSICQTTIYERLQDTKQTSCIEEFVVSKVDESDVTVFGTRQQGVL